MIRKPFKIGTSLLTGISLATFAAPASMAFADTDVVTPEAWRTLAADEDVEIRLDVDRYNVHGNSIPALNRSLRTSGPRATDAAKAIGVHQGRAGVAYTLLQTYRSCELYAHTITYSGTTIVPEADLPADTGATTKRWWNEYVTDIEQHEQEHAFIAILEVYALDVMLDNLAVRATCDDVTAAIRSAYRERWHAASLSNRTYDDWTKHGRLGPYWLS